jgi:adenosylcobinamide-phosphate synthase
MATPPLSPARRRLRGTLAVGLLLTPAVALAMAITRLPCVSDAAAALLLYLALGHRSLHEHTRPIAAALRAGNLDAARVRLGHIVSRDTAMLNTTDIAKGVVESVLENGNIERTLGLVRRGVGLWLAVIGIGDYLLG